MIQLLLSLFRLVLKAMSLPNENNFYYQSVQHLARSLAKIPSLSTEKVLFCKSFQFKFDSFLKHFLSINKWNANIDKYIVFVVSKSFIEWRASDRPKRTGLSHSFSHLFDWIWFSGNFKYQLFSLLNYFWFIETKIHLIWIHLLEIV